MLFSGGVDSSLLAVLAAPDHRLTLRTVGTEGSPDLERACDAARRLGLTWEAALLRAEEMEASWNGWAVGLHTQAEPRRSVLFALGLAFERFPHRCLLLGQGADELFGGYAHFAPLSPEEALERSNTDLARLREHDWPDTLEIARRSEVELAAPFLDPEFIRTVALVPTPLRFEGGDRKPLLRRIARAAGLPEAIAGSPKKAMQYGSGVAKFLRSRPRGG